MDVPKYTALRQKVIDMAGCGGSNAQSVSESREEIIGYIDELIERGDKGLYVMKALLMASDDWVTCKIVRSALFIDIFTEGVRNGCLNPKYIHAWEWIEIAIKYNHPGSFMNDMNLYRRALTDAWENGGEWLARDLLYVIFGTGNCNKED